MSKLPSLLSRSRKHPAGTDDARIPTIAAAQDYPTKPVRVIIPFPPGAINDTVGRLIATQLTNRLGKQFIVDNRAGAGGVVGTELAANAPKDGYTLLVVSLVNTVNPWLYKLNYEPIKSFAPIAFLASSPNMTGRQSAGAGEDARANSSRSPRSSRARCNTHPAASAASCISAASCSNCRRASISARPVPRRRAGHDRRDRRPHQRDLRHHPHRNTAGEGRQGQRARRRGAKRQAALPDVPTADEAGLPGYHVANWVGIVAPAGTPPAIIDKLNKEITAIMQSPEMQKQLENEGLEFISMTPAEFGTFMEKELAKWGRVVKEGGIKAQ